MISEVEAGSREMSLPSQVKRDDASKRDIVYHVDELALPAPRQRAAYTVLKLSTHPPQLPQWAPSSHINTVCMLQQSLQSTVNPTYASLIKSTIADKNALFKTSRLVNRRIDSINCYVLAPCNEAYESRSSGLSVRAARSRYLTEASNF